MEHEPVDFDFADNWAHPYLRRYFTSSQKQAIFERDNGLCSHCGKRLEFSEVEFDHVYPWSRGGATVVSNGVVSCSLCNHRRIWEGRRLPFRVGPMFLRRVLKAANYMAYVEYEEYWNIVFNPTAENTPLPLKLEAWINAG